MKVCLDLNPGDSVWFMYKNAAVCGTVQKSRYGKFRSNVDQKSIIESETYTVFIGNKEIGIYQRKELFRTKEELINSL